MKRSSKSEAVWVATAEVGKLRLIAISTARLKPPDLRMQFHSTLVKDLDALFKVGKAALRDPKLKLRKKKAR